MLKLPLNGKGLYQTIDAAFDKAVAATQPLRDLANSIVKIADAVQRLGLAVAVLAHNQEVLQSEIVQMKQHQGIIFRKLVGSGLDTSMPKIKEDEPEDKKAARNKPN